MNKYEVTQRFVELMTDLDEEQDRRALDLAIDNAWHVFTVFGYPTGIALTNDDKVWLEWIGDRKLLMTISEHGVIHGNLM